VIELSGIDLLSPRGMPWLAGLVMNMSGITLASVDDRRFHAMVIAG